MIDEALSLAYLKVLRMLAPVAAVDGRL